MTNMNPTDLNKGVDHAAGMDGRRLFVASLVVFDVFAALVMGYFVGQHERLIEDHKQARDSYRSFALSLVWGSHGPLLQAIDLF